MTKRILSLVLCVLMLLSCVTLFACGEDTGKDPAKTTDPSNPAGTTAPTTTADLCPIEKQDLDGYEFLALEGFFGLSESTDSDFTVKEENASVLDEAKYKRNTLVEDRLNTTITATQVKCGSTTGSNEGYGLMMKYKTSGDPSYDTVVLPAYDQSKLAYNGGLYDFTHLPNINLKSPYWDQHVVEELTIKDMLFFLEGDYSITAFNATVICAFNKELAKQKGINDLYQLVDEGKWTMAKWMEYTEMFSEDLNGDDRFTNEDLYGTLSWDDAIYAVVHSSGSLCCDLDANGDLILTCGTEAVVSVFEEFVTFAQKNCFLRFQQTFNPDGSAVDNSASTYGSEMFLNNQSLFLLVALGTINGLRDMETDYGILPIFKYSEQQDRYYATVSPYSARFMGVPVNLEDAERTGTILETIGYYSAQLIPNAYYSKALYGSKIRDEESQPVLEMLRENRVYDLGYFYQPGNINKQFIVLFRAGTSNWSSTYGKLEKAANTILTKQINSAFTKLHDSWANG